MTLPSEELSENRAPAVPNQSWPGRLRSFRQRYIRRETAFPAFWTVASVISLVINIILIAILLFVGRQLFTIRSLASDRLVDGMYTNFVKMDAAHISTTIDVKDTILVSDTIQVKDSIQVVFDLPLKQKTNVTLVEDTSIDNATIFLNGSPVNLNIILPKGTKLGINLNLIVPVNQSVPVTLNVPVHLNVPVSMKVPVDIPLNQTQLHDPFVGLQNVVSPFRTILSGLPGKVNDIPLCFPGANWFCRWYFQTK